MRDHDTHDRDIDDDRFRPDDHPRLGALSDFDDFEVADGYPDPRGWHVIASDGTDIGKVHDLIVDTGTMHTRYLDVRLDHDHIPAAAGRPTDDWDVLVPIGSAQLASNDDEVRLPSLTPAQLVSFPVFNHGEITTDYENAVLAGAGAATAADMNRAAPPPREHVEHVEHAEHAERVAERDSLDARDTTRHATVRDNEIRIPVTPDDAGAPVVREEIVITRHRVLGDRNTSSDSGEARNS